jgi:hypothetical protein
MTAMIGLCDGDLTPPEPEYRQLSVEERDLAGDIASLMIIKEQLDAFRATLTRHARIVDSRGAKYVIKELLDALENGEHDSEIKSTIEESEELNKILEDRG